MAFNDKPYKSIKLTFTDTDPSSPTYEQEITHEYSKVVINTFSSSKTVWRKPLDYSKSLLIVDADGNTKSQDAVGDGGMTFSVQRYNSTNNLWSTVPYTEDISSVNIIKYEDYLKYVYSLATGYSIYANDSYIENPSGQDISLSNNTPFTVLNNFDIDIKIVPIFYNLIVNTDSGTDGYVINYVPGSISEIQGKSSGVITTDDELCHGDTVSIFYSIKEGYNTDINSETIIVNSGSISGQNIIAGNTTSVKTFTVRYTTTDGVQEVALTRTYRRLPSTSYDQVSLSNGSSINYGDNVKVKATASTGYTLDNYSTAYTYTNLTSNLNISVTAHKTYGTLHIVYDNTKISSVTIMDTNWHILQDGDTVIYGDYLLISAVAATGYELDTYTSPVKVIIAQDGDTFTVELTAHPKEYIVSVAADSNSINDFTITRTSSPMGGSTGLISNNSVVYYGDILEVDYNTNTNYVIATSGSYSTSEVLTFTCNTFDNSNKFTINLSGVYTTPIVLSQYSYLSQNTLLDNEDLSTIKVRYDSYSNSPVTYDPSRRVRVDSRVYIKGLDQITYINQNMNQSDVYFKDFNGNTPEHIEISTIEWYYILDPTVPYKILYTPIVKTIQVRLVCDTCKVVKPSEALTQIVVTSKYANSKNINEYLVDYTYHEEDEDNYYIDVNCYYKDNVKIYCSSITGWDNDEIEVNYEDDQGSAATDYISFGENITLIENDYIFSALRNIKSYNLTFQNKYAKFTNIVINNVEQLSSPWIDTAGGSTKAYTIDYGSKFYKVAVPLDNNDPMNVQTISHINSMTYNVTQNTTVQHRYYLSLVAPSMGENDVYATWSSTEITTYKMGFSLDITNNNNASGFPYTVFIQVDKLENGQTETIINTSVTMNSSTQYFSGIRSGTLQASPTSKTVTFNIKVWFGGKTLGVLPRTNSPVTEVQKTRTIPGYNE